jgi:hypothetical protein
MRLGYVAAAWSIGYAGVLATDRASLIPPEIAVVLGALGACVALVMAAVPGSARRGYGRAGLLAFAWGTVLALLATAEALAIVGALVWVVTAVVFQRRSRGACVVCGRWDADPAHADAWNALREWSTPIGAARWGAWTLGVAVAIPALALTNRWPADLGGEPLVPDAIVTASAVPLAGTPVVWLVWVGALVSTGYAWHLRRRGACTRCGRC